MKLSIQSIHFTADTKLLDYVQKKCDKLDHFYDRITDGDVFLKLVEGKKNKSVEIKMRVPGETLVAHEAGTTFEEATDLCVDKLKTQLIRYKEKQRSY